MEALDVWATIILSASAVAIGLYKYFHARADELRWRQAEFVLNQAHYLETDEEILDAVMLLRGENIYSVADIFGDESQLSDEEIYRWRRKFYKLLNLMDRLGYLCLDKKAVSVAEMSNFGMYYTLVRRNKRLRKYCQRCSFTILLRMADALEQYFRERHEANRVRTGI